MFSVVPIVIQLCFVQLKTLAPSARSSTFKYPVTVKPGLGSLKVIKNYITKSGTHDFLLTFPSNHRPISHPFRDKLQYLLKIAKFSYPRVLNVPDEGVPLGICYWRKGSRNASMMGLPDGGKSFKIVLVVLIQYRL